MTFALKRDGKFLIFNQYTTHTGTHREPSWTEDINNATIFQSIIALPYDFRDEARNTMEPIAVEVVRTVRIL